MCCDSLLSIRQPAGVASSDPSFHLDLEPKPMAARAARRFVAEHVGEAGGDGALTLLTSEVVTNGVLHARTRLRVGITTGDDHVLVTCGDDDLAGAPSVPPRDEDRPSGRGLLLVSSMASQWGVVERNGGKTVWFTLPRRAES